MLRSPFFSSVNDEVPQLWGSGVWQQSHLLFLKMWWWWFMSESHVHKKDYGFCLLLLGDLWTFPSESWYSKTHRALKSFHSLFAPELRCPKDGKSGGKNTLELYKLQHNGIYSKLTIITLCGKTKRQTSQSGAKKSTFFIVELLAM